MIGRCLKTFELNWVQLHADRLLACGFTADAADCGRDLEFAGIDPRWQALILADIRFVLTQPLNGAP